MILTHTTEGQTFLSSEYPWINAPVKVIPHPVDSKRRFVKRSSVPEFDLLLWGALLPYKGIPTFLEAVAQNSKLRELKIKIIGKAQSTEYFERIKAASTQNIDLENRFPDFKEIEDLTSRSRATLFTYERRSILSSGVLMDALSLGAFVIGPRVGAFIDLAACDVISAYDTYHEIPRILERSENFDRNILSDWVQQNTWENFGQIFFRWFNDQVSFHK
jgi:glycosyltransferase involved in cell wall biosynthesis